MSKLHNRMRKILALAQRGEGGERANAQRMLESLLLKYNMSIDDLEGDEVAQYWWNFDSKHEKRLLIQCAAKTLDVSKISFYQGDRKLGFMLTQAQHVEMDLEYNVLRRELKKHIDRAVAAFIQANGVYSTASASDKEFTEEEIAEMERVLRMANGIEKTPILRQLK